MATWVEDIEQALETLGGIAVLVDIYDEVKHIRNHDVPNTLDAIVREGLEHNSRGMGHDVFYCVEGIGRGVWGLKKKKSLPTPEANDINSPSDEVKERILLQTYRIVRDTALTRVLKSLHRYECQLCGEAIEFVDGRRYAEGHHIKPLGEPHNGPDIGANILILCPNHHVMCDYGVVHLRLVELKSHPLHNVSQEFIDYYSEFIFQK